MCQQNDVLVTGCAQTKRGANKSPSWRKVRLMRPKLNRQVVPNSRVNLNQFWSSFGTLHEQKQPLVDFFARNSDNEVNDNILNEYTDSLKKW